MEKTMKRWLYVIIMAVMAVSFSACSDKDKDDEPDSYSSLIVGTWRTTSSYYSETYTFDTNGKFTYTYKDVDDDIFDAGTYSIKGDVLTVTSPGSYVDVYTIHTLTKTRLVVRYEGEYVGEYQDDYRYEEYYRVD